MIHIDVPKIGFVLVSVQSACACVQPLKYVKQKKGLCGLVKVDKVGISVSPCHTETSWKPGETPDLKWAICATVQTSITEKLHNSLL